MPNPTLLLAPLNGTLTAQDRSGATPSGTTPPVSNTTAVAVTEAGQRKVSTINAAKRAYAIQNHVPLVDMTTPLADSATGLFRDGFTNDGVHPSIAGYRALGVQAWTALGPLFRPHRPYGSLHNLDPNNRVLDNTSQPNGMFGTGSASVPAGWSVYGGSASGTTNAREPREGHNGNALIIVRTIPDTRVADGVSAPVTAGHWYVFAGTIELDGGDEGAICAFAVRWGNNVVAHQFYLAEDRGPVRFQSWPLLAPSGVTTIYVRATLALAPATLAFSELTIYDLTALGLA